MIEDIREKDVVEALRKARQFADRIHEMAATMPARDAERLVRSSTSMVTNLAMALEVLRKHNGSDATGSSDQV